MGGSREAAQRHTERAMLEGGQLQGQFEAQQELLDAGDERQRAAEVEAERLRRII